MVGRAGWQPLRSGGLARRSRRERRQSERRLSERGGRASGGRADVERTADGRAAAERAAVARPPVAVTAYKKSQGERAQAVQQGAPGAEREIRTQKVRDREIREEQKRAAKEEKEAKAVEKKQRRVDERAAAAAAKKAAARRAAEVSCSGCAGMDEQLVAGFESSTSECKDGGNRICELLDQTG